MKRVINNTHLIHYTSNEATIGSWNYALTGVATHAELTKDGQQVRRVFTLKQPRTFLLGPKNTTTDSLEKIYEQYGYSKDGHIIHYKKYSRMGVQQTQLWEVHLRYGPEGLEVFEDNKGNIWHKRWQVPFPYHKKWELVKKGESQLVGQTSFMLSLSNGI